MKQERQWYVIILFLLGPALLVTGVWVTRIMRDQAIYIDQMTREVVRDLSGTSVYTIFRWLTELGSGTFLTPLTILTAILLWRLFHDYLPAIFIGLGTLTTHGLNSLIKVMIERERPSVLAVVDAEGYSFPSGHAMIPMVCYGLLAYFITKKFTSSKAAIAVQFSLALLVFLIGISRYVLNVHYITDVFAGFVFGFIFLVGLIYLYELIQKNRRVC